MYLQWIFAVSLADSGLTSGLCLAASGGWWLRNHSPVVSEWSVKRLDWCHLVGLDPVALLSEEDLRKRLGRCSGWIENDAGHSKHFGPQ